MKKMKEKIKFLVLGILIGAVITAGVFILLKNNASSKMPNMRPDNMNFEDFENFDFPSDMKERKERTSKDNTEKTSENAEETSSDETTNTAE